MNKSLLETRDLRKSFPVKMNPFSRPVPLKAVNGLTISLGAGETLGVAGESGSGKSTFGKLLVGLLRPDCGDVIYQGKSIGKMSGAELLGFRKEVQMIFQDPYSSLNPRMRVGEIIGEPLKIHGLADGAGLRELTGQLMRRVGLSDEHYFRYPHEFSGGQRQRIGIARALAVNPRLIIADEPVSALDLSIQAQIINLLQELKTEYALSYVLIAHDLSVLRFMSDRIAVMYLGAIVEIGRTEDVFEGFLHPYTEALISAAPHVQRPTATKRIVLRGDLPSPLALPGGCSFHPRCPYAESGKCDVSVPLLEEKKPGHMAACHFSAQLYR